MKRFFTLLLAAALIGFVLFALTFWLFGTTRADAIDLALSSALAGLGAEYLGPIISKLVITRKENIP